MIVWSEAVRNQDPSYFCQLATSEATGPVWLVCDARRESDMLFFKQHHGSCLLTVRVEASIGVRQERGWVYNQEVDDAPSECGLDHYNCDMTVNNTSPSQQDLMLQLHKITTWVKMMTSSS